ncbi:hypothetical protein [Wolbachia endosymbiont (group A) of Volucella inflata]|uniref:hypothetical protein n=1 Tax=Wolbachia endosymbiont (group A) of Volucella inflata TaxID=2954065 RepID=UPI002225D89E|nr:hypothetical protein [Wolbachia endosymbiont (group A) of Volucella inflata]
MNEIDFINTNHLLNLEQEFGNGYIKLTDGSFNEYTGHYQIGSEILDESHNMIGDLTIDQLCFFKFFEFSLITTLVYNFVFLFN